MNKIGEKYIKFLFPWNFLQIRTPLCWRVATTVIPNEVQMANYRWRTKESGPEDTCLTLTLPVAGSTQLLRVILVERGNRVVHCPEGICVLFIYGAERQEGEVRLVERWGGYEMIEDVCPHVCNSLGWVEGLGGGEGKN